MAEPWINKKDWLKGYVEPRKPTAIIEEQIIKNNNQQKKSIPQKIIPIAVPYYPIKCPKCDSKKVKLYKTNLPIRYYICKCGWHFKSIEVNST
jgi:hypothetical protein